MSQARIQFDDVASAAEALAQAGEHPTIEKIRDHLGKRGSYSTISKHLKSWRDERTDPPASQPPSDAIQHAVQSVWQRLNQESEDKIATIKAEADERVATAEGQAQTMQNQLAGLQDELNTLKESYNELSAQKELLSLDHKQLQENHALLEERHQSLEERYHEMKTLSDAQLNQAKVDHQAEISRLREHSQREVKAAEKLADTLKAHYEQARADNMMNLDKLKVDNQKLYAELKQLEVDNSTLSKEAASQARLADQANQQLEKAEAFIVKQQAQWDEIKDKQFVTKAIVAELEAIPRELSQKTQSELNKQLKASIHDIVKSMRPKKKAKANA